VRIFEAVWAIEDGERGVEIYQLCRIAAIFSKDITYLFQDWPPGQRPSFSEYKPFPWFRRAAGRMSCSDALLR
jgi:hypothetical protein